MINAMPSVIRILDRLISDVKLFSTDFLIMSLKVVDDAFVVVSIVINNPPMSFL
ncbi:hypothetical protein D3C79_1071080 [compost metagenome]